MRNEITVDRATVGDLTLVAPLFDGYRQFYKQASDLDGAQDFLKQRLVKEESVIFLASSNGKSVGFTQLYPSFSSVRMRKIWVLNDLFVLSEARKQGVATKLMEAAVAFAKSTDAHHLVLSTAKTNPAQHLYRQFGWKLDEEYDQFYFELS